MIDSQTKAVWLDLIMHDKPRTASEVAKALDMDVQTAFNRLSCMRRRNQVRAFAPEGSRWLRYWIDGTCIVPTGIAVAEVMAACN